MATQLIRFSVPFLLSTIIQQLYGAADMVIVGWFSGPASLSGVNNGGQLTFLATALAIGLAVGGTILIGQYHGARRDKDLAETVSTMLTALLLIGVALTAVFLLLDDVLLRAIQVPAESYDEAHRYLDICLWGLVFIFMYNAISGTLRGMGDSKRPLYFVSIACVMNVVLDLLFVGVFGLGASGAAFATIISQAFSVVVSAVYLARGGFLFDFKLRSFVLHKDKLALILKLGIPASVQQVVTNLSFLLLTTIVNGYGVTASAAAAVASKFNGFAIMPANAISNSVSMMSAQNIGAGLFARAKKTMWVGVLISSCVGALVFAIVQFFPEAILGLFTPDAEVIEAGVLYMRAFSWDYLLVPFAFNFMGLINGAGHTTFSLISSFVSAVGLRIPLALLLSFTAGWGLYGVGLSVPLASLGGAMISLIYILSGRWTRIKTNIRRQETALEETLP